MGGEVGQWHEWNHDESVQWHLLQWESHQGMQNLIKDLNRVYQEQPALHEVDFTEAGFEWLDSHNAEESVIAYVRKGKDPGNMVAVMLNLTPVPRLEHRVGVPGPGWYEEIFNSDSERYAGSNIGNGNGCEAEAIPWNGRDWSIRISLPPLGALMFKPHWK